MLNSKELYSKISEWREEKGWTENKLCDMAGVSHSMFHSWVSRGTMPKLDTLESLCYALDKPLAALLFDVDENKLTGEEIQLLSMETTRYTTEEGNYGYDRGIREN